MNVTIGPECDIAPSAIIGRIAPRGWTARDPGHPARVRIGGRVLVGAFVVIYAGCTVGDGCLLGDGSSLYTACTLERDVRLGRLVTLSYDVTLGAGTVVMDGSHLTGGFVCGAGCFIGPSVTTANDRTPTRPYDAGRLAPPRLGREVIVGAGAVIHPGVTIGDGAVIGAGAIVARDVPPDATIAPLPGRRIPV